MTSTLPSDVHSLDVDSDVVHGGRRTRSRTAKFWGILVVLLIAATLISILTRSSEDPTPLSPLNPSPEGARAVSEVLRDHGVDVKYATTLDAAVAHLERAGERSTLLLDDTSQWLDTEQLHRLADTNAGQTVLAAPTFDQLEVLAPGLRHAGLLNAEDEDKPLHAECPLPAAVAAEKITAGGQSYRGGIECFPSPSGPADSGSLVITNSGSTVVLGNPQLISNGAVADHGNAALALHLLGSEPVLVWYQPSVSDLTVDEQQQNPSDLLPPWVGNLMWWLVVVAVFAAFWRARRLGPLVTEPLPVVVRSSETADGRARLYQEARAVEHAGETFRSASLVRIARHLGLGRVHDVNIIISSTARTLSRDPQQVADVLGRAAPTTEIDLVRWAQELTALEKEVATA